MSAGVLPEGSNIAGATFVFPREQATDLILVNLEMPEGGTHLQQGAVAEFTVQAQ